MRFPIPWTAAPRPSPSFHPLCCSIAKPLFDGPKAIHTGGTYFSCVDEGGGSRAKMSARVGAGVARDGNSSDRIAFMMNQLFLFFLSCVLLMDRGSGFGGVGIV